ncbi:MAG: glycosyltransferase family 39 protein [Kiritimatiellia bacterium]
MAVGVFVRLYGLSGQIPLDDEWHSLNFVLDKSFWEVLATHGLGANCIPQNAIHWLMLHTIGWSEIALYLPSVFCGIAGLLVFPRLVSGLAGRTTAILFAWLLAISPCATFYSRIARPYAMVLFFGFLALLCLALWTRDGRRRQLVAYVLSGFVATYFHLYAAVPVLAPLAALLFPALSRRKAPADAPWICAKTLMLAGLALASLLAIFLGPAHWQNPWWMQALAWDRVTARGLWDFLSLLAGTGNFPGKLVFATLAGYGLRTWLGKEFRVGILWGSVWAAFSLLLIFATQDGMHAGIQIARYNIVLFPVAMLLAAYAAANFLDRFPAAIRRMAGAVLVGGLVAASPLWRTYAQPNNFMHHSAFQDSYAPFDWSRSRPRLLRPQPQMSADRIHPFYAALAANPAIGGIVEYPMYMGDSLNLHYFTQHVHGKPVVAGYVPDFPFDPLPSRNDFICQTTPLDYVFSRARNLGLHKQMRFRNLLSITDRGRLSQRHSGWLLVVHRDLLTETLNVRDRDAPVRPPAVLESSLAAAWGAPVFSDPWIAAWKIP